MRLDPDGLRHVATASVLKGAIDMECHSASRCVTLDWEPGLVKGRHRSHNEAVFINRPVRPGRSSVRRRSLGVGSLVHLACLSGPVCLPAGFLVLRGAHRIPLPACAVGGQPRSDRPGRAHPPPGGDRRGLLPRREGGAFTTEDEETLVMFASQAALVIANARRHREERRARTDLEALIDTSPVGVLVFDARTGGLTSINREARRIVNGLCFPGGSAVQYWSEELDEAIDAIHRRHEQE